MVSREEKAEGRFSEFRWEICVRVGLDPVSRGWPGWDGIWKIRKRVCISLLLDYNSYKYL